MNGKNDFDLLEAVAKMAHDLGSLYNGNRSARADLLDFMDANEWFGNKAPGNVTASAFENMKESLTLWLSAYKQPGRKKIDLMLWHFRDSYPITCQLYRDFVTQKGLGDEPAAWRLLDYLLCEIDREITTYDETGFEHLAKQLDTGATLKSAQLFSDFLRSAKYKGKPLAKWSYTFHSREATELINDAYPADAFAAMAYCVFNKKMWEKQGLVQKALQSPGWADLWLFAALHFICALRPGDMTRLPAPALPYEGVAVLEKIATDAFTKREAIALSDELCIRLKLKPMKPSKTSAHKSVPSLKLFVPESLREPLGFIMAISLAHHPETKPGDGFIAPLSNLGTIRNFFGPPFVNALGNRHLSPRRCNKSYLQGIDLAAGSGRASGKPKGYMLAALARSHKGGIGSLAKTTEIYLKDARFSGYSPQFIIREMFERGVFSFIPAVLLEMYAGPEYTALPITAQTQLIRVIGLSAYQIEQVAGLTERALAKSRRMVNSVLCHHTGIHDKVFSLLQNIASGNAPSKQNECLCLLTAAGSPCACPRRDSCLGCGYEIYTKTAMHTLMKEYIRLSQLHKGAAEPDKWRSKAIVEQAVLPAISEMLNAAHILYQGADNTGLLDIVERGMQYADGSP